MYQRWMTIGPSVSRLISLMKLYRRVEVISGLELFLVKEDFRISLHCARLSSLNYMSTVFKGILRHCIFQLQYNARLHL